MKLKTKEISDNSILEYLSGNGLELCMDGNKIVLYVVPEEDKTSPILVNNAKEIRFSKTKDFIKSKQESLSTPKWYKRYIDKIKNSIEIYLEILKNKLKKLRNK